MSLIWEERVTKSEEEVQKRRARFREQVQNDPELRKDFIIGLQWAAPAAWEKMLREK